MTTRFTVSEKQYMLHLIRYAESLIIKSKYDASLGETEDSKKEGNLYVLAKQDKDTFYDYSITKADIENAGLSRRSIDLFTGDKALFYEVVTSLEKEAILTYLRSKTIRNYVEKNPYYRMLNGEPPLGTEAPIVEDIYEGGRYYVYQYSETFHARMFSRLLFDDQAMLKALQIQEKQAGRPYEYFDYMPYKTPYHIARQARNFQILYAGLGILDEDDARLFNKAYNEALEYINVVFYIKNYGETEDLYDRYIITCILFLAFLRFLSRKVEGYIRNEFLTVEDKKLFFRQYDMEDLMYMNLSESVINSLIVWIDDLIAAKGSELAATKVLKMFQFKNIEIFKYLVIKMVKCNPITKEILMNPEVGRNDNYDIRLVKIPITTVLEGTNLSKFIANKQNHILLEKLALPDPYFGGVTITESNSRESSKRKLILEVEKKLKEQEEFAWFYTRYMGLTARIDFTDNSNKSSYFIVNSLLNDEDVLNFSFTMNRIGQNLTVRDSIAAINLMIHLRYGETDYVPDSHENYLIRGFNIHANSEELHALPFSITERHVRTPEEFRSAVVSQVLPPDAITLVKRKDAIPLRGRSRIEQSFEAYEYNLAAFYGLSARIGKTENFEIHRALRLLFGYNMNTPCVRSLFDTETYSAYLQRYKPVLYEYMYSEINRKTNGHWDDANGNPSEEFLNACSDILEELITDTFQKLGVNSDLTEIVVSLTANTNAIFTKIMNILLLFKHYTVDFTAVEILYIVGNDPLYRIKLFDFPNTMLGMGGRYVTSLMLLYTHSAKKQGRGKFTAEIDYKLRDTSKGWAYFLDTLSKIVQEYAIHGAWNVREVLPILDNVHSLGTITDTYSSITPKSLVWHSIRKALVYAPILIRHDGFIDGIYTSIAYTVLTNTHTIHTSTATRIVGKDGIAITDILLQTYTKLEQHLHTYAMINESRYHSDIMQKLICLDNVTGTAIGTVSSAVTMYHKAYIDYNELFRNLNKILYSMVVTRSTTNAKGYDTLISHKIDYIHAIIGVGKKPVATNLLVYHKAYIEYDKLFKNVNDLLTSTVMVASKTTSNSYYRAISHKIEYIHTTIGVHKRPLITNLEILHKAYIEYDKLFKNVNDLLTSTIMLQYAARGNHGKERVLSLVSVTSKSSTQYYTDTYCTTIPQLRHTATLSAPLPLEHTVQVTTKLINTNRIMSFKVTRIQCAHTFNCMPIVYPTIPVKITISYTAQLLKIPIRLKVKTPEISHTVVPQKALLDAREIVTTRHTLITNTREIRRVQERLTVKGGIQKIHIKNNKHLSNRLKTINNLMQPAVISKFFVSRPSVTHSIIKIEEH
jgi:hypothetical protein